ncbi:MAG TPA: ATPase, T2SS/T4P/T4SS family, partial [Methylococcales bacterium]
MESGQNVANTEMSLLFGEWLVSKGLLPPSDLAEALDEQHRSGGKLGEVLLRLKILGENDITAALSEYLGLERAELDNISRLDMNVARLIPENIAKRFCAIAVGEEQDSIVVAMADPLNVIAIDTIKHKIKRPVKVVISSSREIYKCIEAAFHGSDMEEQRLRDLVQLEASDEVVEDFFDEDMTSADISSEALASKPPVIRFVDLLLSQAVKSRASDIHVEPQENSIAIRMRIDGMLREMVPPSRKMQSA